MKSNLNCRLPLILIPFVTTLFLDLMSKAWARERLEGNTYSYLGNFFVLQHSENPGAFLSLGAGMGEAARFWVFTVGIALIMLGILFYLVRTSTLPALQTVAYSLVASGGIGNLVDRVMKQSVTDFMNMGIGQIRTGIFNIADMAIMLGLFILIADSFRQEQKSKKPS